MSSPSVLLPVPALVGVEGFYCTGEDWLRVSSLNSVAGVTLEIGGRFLPIAAPRPHPLRERHVPNTDRTYARSDHVLGEGWIQNLTVSVSAAAPLIGQTYVRIDVIRGRDSGAVVVASLLAGYVTGAQRRAWPGSPLQGTLDGPGAIRAITGTDPAAGVEITETVPAGARWRALSLLVELVTDATAATRETAIVYDDGATVYTRVPANQTHTASTTRRTQWGVPIGASGGQVDLTTVRSVPDVRLLAGHRIRTITQALQAGDNYGAPALLVEEWIEGA